MPVKIARQLIAHQYRLSCLPFGAFVKLCCELAASAAMQRGIAAMGIHRLLTMLRSIAYPAASASIPSQRQSLHQFLLLLGLELLRVNGVDSVQGTVSFHAIFT
jgi:hypothetical protein